MALSPLMVQYLEVKEKNKDTLIFFRVGDFYEMFFDDAKLVSQELELTLTGKECGLEERAPMCGVPYHSVEGYIAKLVEKGYKVAICEQTEDPSKAKGLVKREIVRIVTPGTVMESSMLDESSNNFICTVFTQKDKTGLSFCDISTGELYATLAEGDGQENKIKDELLKFSPKEILIGGDAVKFKTLAAFIKDKLSASVSMLDDEEFSFAESEKVLLKQFHKNSLEELQLESSQQTVSALGALLSYLSRTQMNGLERIDHIEIYKENQYLHIDYNTRRNLELTEPLNSKNKSASLLAVLDKTKTSMGKRMMKSCIEKPLVSMAQIVKKQNGVTELYENVMMRMDLREALVGITDIQRIITRIVYGSANARELRSMCNALKRLPTVRATIKDGQSGIIKSMYNDLDSLDDICKLIDEAIVDDPPFTVKEGGMIKEGYNKELDEIRYDMNNSSSILAKIEARERTETGIPKLKIGYNRVFGYYIEVSNSYKNMVPESYIRKQTLTNGERFITQELKELEQRILGAKDRSFDLEYAIFDYIRTTVAKSLARINKTANAVATLDVIASLAQAAFENNYCCPTLTADGVIKLTESRHPVVESISRDIRFVPNDVFLDTDENRVAIITGPNMAGKSTYMRQVALIVLMAQMGSYVPAKSAQISIVDSIFTRIGASDDLATGQSTFMVEMNEVAYILKNATKNSLLILDEIGRGTSTFDGMSIAKAVLEYVADKKILGAKTLFATHYHELTVLEDTVKGVKNYNIAAIKRGDDITFLRRIIRGAADESYGVEVAKLAGLPESVIERAKKILLELESGQPKQKRKVKKHEETPQMTFMQEETAVEKRLKSIDINTVTPMEAMNILFELMKMIK